MAQDKKITQLDVLTQAASADVLVIVDTTIPTATTKQISAQNLFASPQPIGSTTPSTGAFTSLELPTGATINEFSTDGTLAGDSDTAVPTESAVKTYVDAAVGSVTNKIIDGDVSVTVTDSTSFSGITFADAGTIATITTDGMQFVAGTRVNEFSTDGTLFDNSDTAVPTEKAVRTYVDTQIAVLEVQSDKNDYMLPPQEIAQNSIYTLTQTAKLEALYDQQLPKVTSTVPAIGVLKATPGDIEDLENGNYAVTTTNGVNCYLSIIGPDGTTVVDNKVVSEFDSDAYDTSEVCRLQNGKIVVFYSAPSGGLKFRFYDPDGNALDSTSQYSITTNVVGQYRAARLTNEKFFIVYSDVTDGNTKYIIINEDGTQFITEQILFANTTSFIRAATLTNGNIVVTYQDVNNVGNEYLYLKIIEPSGVVSVAQTQVSDSVCSTSPDQAVDVLALPNGNAFITYSDNTLNAKFKVFNGYGAELIGETTYTSSGNIHWVAASYLPDGRVFTAAYESSTPLTYYTILDRDGSQIVQWTENTSHHQHLYSVIGKSGKIAVAWVDTVDPNCYVELYEGLGTKIDGYLALASGTRVNEISNDTSLAGSSSTALITENAAKTYIDAQIAGFASNRIYQGDSSVTANDNTSLQNVVIEVPTTVPGPDATSVQLIYFNGVGSSNWINSTSMVDGNVGTFARAGYPAGAYVQVNNSIASFDSTAIVTTGTVEKVELRVYAQSGGTATRAELFPRFNGTTNGSAINIIAAGGYTPWVDITNDASGPGSGNWTWSDVQNLDSQVEADIPIPGGGPSDYFNVSIVQVRVTTSAAGAGTDGKVEAATFDSNGLTLQQGASVNEFSTDELLSGNSNDAVPTERAVKTYIDNKIVSTGVLNVYMLSSDSTAFNGDAVLVDTTSGDVNIVLDTYPDSRIIVKKITPDSNVVNITVNGGTIDGQSVQTITEVYKSYTFISDGGNYYVV